MKSFSVDLARKRLHEVRMLICECGVKIREGKDNDGHYLRMLDKLEDEAFDIKQMIISWEKTAERGKKND